MADIFHIDRLLNKITLGTTGTTINIASHTASLLLGLDASKNLESVDLSGVYQPLDVVLTDLAALGIVVDNEFIVGTGAGVYAHESGATVRTSLGLGTGDSPLFASISIGNADTTITRISGGVIAVEGTTVMMVGDAPTSHVHDDRYYTETEIGDNYQPLSAVLTNLADLFISGQNHLEFQSANNYIYGYTISQLHLISTGEIHLIAGGAYSLKVIHDLGCLFNAGIYITEQASASGSTATYGQLWTKSGTPNTLWFTDDTGDDFQLGVSAGADEKVKIDSGATAGYIGASPVSGVLRTSTGLNYADGGDFITLSVDVGIEDDEIVQIDSGTVADNDYAKFTVNGLEGRSSAEVLSDLSATMSAAFNLNGQDLINGGIISLTEQAAAEGNIAGRGQFWVKDDAPCVPMFTDDEGGDFQLGVGGGWIHDGSTTINLTTLTDTFQDVNTGIGGRGIVFLKVKPTQNVCYIFFKTKGESDTESGQVGEGIGCSAGRAESERFFYVWCETDSSGFVQAKKIAGNNSNVTITVMGYLLT